MTVEYEVLEKALSSVYSETGLRLTTHKAEELQSFNYDATVDLEGYPHIHFTVEIKRWAQHVNFAEIVNRIKQLPMKGMLIADYVNPKMADRLREHDVPFIDTFGNAYINEKPVYVFIKNNKSNHKEVQEALRKGQERGRAFTPTGLKVVFAFMRKLELINAPYRQIADEAGVALGTVGWVINDLIKGGYLIEVNKKNRRLKNRKKMLDKWVDAYLEKLRPSQFIGKFSTATDMLREWSDHQIREYGAKWGGEIAAAKLTGYLKPEQVTIYLPKGGGNQIFNDFQLRKNSEGNINVYRAFWNEDPCGDLATVDPIIVYADLLATGDVRNLEAAGIIYDQKLAEFIEQD